MSTCKSTLALAALATILASCISPEEHKRALNANNALQSQLADLNEYQERLNEENNRLRGEVDLLGRRAADAEWIKEQKAKLDQLLSEYQTGGPKAMPGVEVVQTNLGVAFRVLGGVLFDSGKVEVTAAGQGTLEQLIATLQSQNKDLRVDGHTDDQKIVHSSWKTNLRLSCNRALAVADFLIANGLPEDRVSVAGFGEFRPAVAGDTDAARQANRRVEIVMLDR